MAGERHRLIKQGYMAGERHRLIKQGYMAIEGAEGYYRGHRAVELHKLLEGTEPLIEGTVFQGPRVDLLTAIIAPRLALKFSFTK
jgi:hypothetical protein